jgi:hypothetical protein
MASGAKPDRAQLRRLLDQFDAVDVMMVTRLDRQRAAPRHVEHARGDHRQGQPRREARAAHGTATEIGAGVTLRLQRINGIVRSSSGPGQYMVWEIAR